MILKAIGEAIAEYVIPPLVEAVTAKVVELLPLIAATAAKALADQLPEILKGVLDADPDLPVISDIVDVSEIIRRALEGLR